MDNRIRVSCASLASIKINNKYLLCINKAGAKKGDLYYSPFGGSLEYKPNALTHLNNLECEFERKTPDLRLFMDESNIPLFTMWFEKKVDREIGIDRELIEEMVDEEKVFSSLDNSDFNSEIVKTTKSVVYSESVKTMCHYFFEIYRVEFNDDKLKEIMDFINKTERISLLSEEEIMNGESSQGIKISASSKSIVC